MISRGSRAASSLVLALLAAAAAGCASSGGFFRVQEEDCLGMSVLRVTNASGQEVAIHELHRATNATHVVATVGPGSHEITVRSEADYRYRAVSTNTASIQAQRQISRGNAVQLQRECRAPSGS